MISIILVMTVLPQILLVFDWVIDRTEFNRGAAVHEDEEGAEEEEEQEAEKQEIKKQEIEKQEIEKQKIEKQEAKTEGGDDDENE